jgi:hypothetical protein
MPCERVTDGDGKKDSDVPSRYVNWMYLSFADSSVIERFPIGEDSKFQVPMYPTSNLERPEVIGLKDIVSLVSPYSGPVTEPPSDSTLVAEDLAELTDDEFPRYLEITVRRSTKEGKILLVIVF